MLDGGDAFADFATLHTGHVGEHTFFAKIPLGQRVGGQGRSVVGGQGDQVVEHTGFARSVALEVPGALVGFARQLGGGVIAAHELDRKSGVQGRRAWVVAGGGWGGEEVEARGGRGLYGERSH